MILIVGLGNPGQKFQKTRHNVGFRVVDELAKNKTGQFMIAKPQTFMNDSGRAVKKLVSKFKIQMPDLWVIHDDIDLRLGKFKISFGRGSAGHKGVQSIINELKTKDFNRIRIGICPKTGKPKTVEKFVLQNFTKSEEKILEEVIKSAAAEINKLIK